MAPRGNDPESYITEYTLVYGDKPAEMGGVLECQILGIWHSRPDSGLGSFIRNCPPVGPMFSRQRPAEARE